MIKKLSIGFLNVLVIMCFVSISLAAEYSFRGDSGTQSFAIYAGQNEITFSPNKVGSWWFKTYVTSRYIGLNCVNVFLYWKDNNNPNDPWHYWTAVNAYYYVSFPPTRILLYSGQSSIAYKFVVSNYNYFPVSLTINLEKL